MHPRLGYLAYKVLVLVIGTSAVSSCIAGTSETTTTSTTQMGTAERVFLRDCDSKVGGTLADDWQEDALVVGSIAFYSAREYADPSRADEFGDVDDELHPGVKMLVVLDGDEAVKVEVAPGSRDRLSLRYDVLSQDPARGSNLYELSDGLHAVRFAACEQLRGEPTQYNGAFIVAGAGCVELDIGQGSSAPERVHLSFGAGSCP